MALALKFSICQSPNCKDFTFKELTGTYNSINNIIGYGTPNINTTVVTKAVLKVTDPLGVITTIDLYAVGFPVKDITLNGYLITSLNTLSDGKYTFTYTITIPGSPDVVYTKTIYEYFFCNSECCVNKLLPYVETCDCCQDNISQKNYLIAWSMLESLKKAAQCGDSTLFANILKIITKIC